MDPLRGPSLQISSCSSLHRPIGAPYTSSYFMKNVGEKRESLSFYCLDRPLYIKNMALRAMFSLSLPEHVHCTQSTHEHSIYSMISMGGIRYVYFLLFVLFLEETRKIQEIKLDRARKLNASRNTAYLAQNNLSSQCAPSTVFCEILVLFLIVKAVPSGRPSCQLTQSNFPRTVIATILQFIVRL
jgi:hypothetical protein